MAIIKCPLCKKDVKIISFGDRFIGVCCNMVLYVCHQDPVAKQKNAVTHKGFADNVQPD